jgi:hypothetical protein
LPIGRELFLMSRWSARTLKSINDETSSAIA